MSAYSSNIPVPDKLRNEDGTITDLQGNVVANPSPIWQRLQPLPDKTRLPDDTIGKLSDLFGGGGNTPTWHSLNSGASTAWSDIEMAISTNGAQRVKFVLASDLTRTPSGYALTWNPSTSTWAGDANPPTSNVPGGVEYEFAISGGVPVMDQGDIRTWIKIGGQLRNWVTQTDQFGSTEVSRTVITQGFAPASTTMSSVQLFY
jgi:hypothetical protein